MELAQVLHISHLVARAGDNAGLLDRDWAAANL